jgi:hypothetical protein
MESGGWRGCTIRKERQRKLGKKAQKVGKKKEKGTGNNKKGTALLGWVPNFSRFGLWVMAHIKIWEVVTRLACRGFPWCFILRNLAGTDVQSFVSLK